MPRFGYGRFESTSALRFEKKKPKARQEICAPLKWACFLLNFVVFLVGVTFLALGIYLCIKDPRPITEWLDVVLNPSIMNLADFIDYTQEQLECCGASSVSQGFRDWQLSEQFNCNTSNPYPEKCGVPYSCCRKSVVSEAAGSLNPLLQSMRSLECWQNAQSKRIQDIEADIYVRGCLYPLRTLFESHAVHLGAVVAGIILPVCLAVCLSHLLARQIDYQRFLLEREARRYERRKRREQKIQAQYKQQQQASYAAINPEIGYIESDTSNSLPHRSSLERPKNSMSKIQSRERTHTVPPSKDKKRKKRKAISSSPNRKAAELKMANEVSTNPTGIQDPVVTTKKHEKRRRRSMTETVNQAPSADPRIRQWILQQSDFVKTNKNDIS
uniref:Tetraspanin n=1 Tax=Acrobeloides nanus TaxID=290746 RepID=A0A914CTC9_9BILA